MVLPCLKEMTYPKVMLLQIVVQDALCRTGDFLQIVGSLACDCGGAGTSSVFTHEMHISDSSKTLI